MKWFSKNTGSIEAVAALITAFVAVAALVGVKYQLDANDLQQRSQSARDAYRSHLALASASPSFAQPANSCELATGDKAGAYSAFVDHLLYSAEQMLEVETGWEATFVEALMPHRDYLCSDFGPDGGTPETKQLLQSYKSDQCINAKICE